MKLLDANIFLCATNARFAAAYLCALAIENGAELWSCDNDFARFAGLKWTNPLDPHARLKAK